MPNYKALGDWLVKQHALQCEHGTLRSECKTCRIDKEIAELKDYIKCCVENNEALQKENAELIARVVELESEVSGANKMADLHKAFHDLVVKERDLARHQLSMALRGGGR